MGADEKACSKLHLPGYTIRPIPWLLPFKNETIGHYAKRMAASIDDENPVLMGLSFGGMMAIEIAKLIRVNKIILISTIKSRKELPAWMKVSGKLKLHKLFPLKSYKILEPIQNYNLGLQTKEEISMVRSFRKQVPPAYLNWAVNEILNWQNDWHPESFIHIHGDNDKLFPFKNIYGSHVIKRGGHFLIMNRAGEVGKLVIDYLEG